MTEGPAQHDQPVASDAGGASARRLPPIPGAIPEAMPEREVRDRDLFGRVPTGYPDWSHRRGEPRVFALIWMLYLMGVTIIMFGSFMHAVSISSSVTRPAAQRMVLATMLGITLLWPAIRLSQRASDRPVRHVLRDLFVILVPAQAVIWPHAMGVLAGWPMSVLVALACLFGAWGLVVGGLIALGDATAGRCPRWVWMIAVLVVAAGSPAVGLAMGVPAASAIDAARAGWMLAPGTAVLELTRDRSEAGLLSPVFGGHWRLIGATACVGGSLLLMARAFEVASRRRGT